MPQTTALYRGSVTANSSAGQNQYQTLFTLPASGFVAAKLIVNRFLMYAPSTSFFSSSSSNNLSGWVESSAGQFPFLFVNVNGQTSTKYAAIVPSENNSGTAATYSSGGNGISTGVSYTNSHGTAFSDPTAIQQGYIGYNSTNALIPKIVWAGPGDSIAFNISGGINTNTAIFEYLFVAIMES
jgi:hypothetical protein